MYFRTNWQREQQREYELLTRACAVADLSSFGKFKMTGSEARQGCSISPLQDQFDPSGTNQL